MPKTTIQRQLELDLAKRRQFRRLDDETQAMHMLEHVDELKTQWGITFKMQTPRQIYGQPPRRVLTLCPLCNQPVETRVFKDEHTAWTEPVECPKCHVMIPSQGKVHRIKLKERLI